jgi:crotonobetainyl-CoA:carnitine CoA-transferase CaiB-like acyl-CoA transferase
MSDYLFSGLKVIDCATVIAAPVAAMMLGDFGADVIKIEQPGDGDMLRMLSDLPQAPKADSDWFWQMDGRNKRGLTLDLKSQAGQDILRKLVAECDVFITNQPYKVRETLKLSFEDLQPLNPKMIYASLTAYGEKGPERDRKGFDQLAYWARSGLMDLMRERGTRPTQGLAGMGDHPTGVAIYAGIVTALLQRERTGVGGMVHTSLLANGLWSAAGVAQGAMAGGDMETYRENSKVYASMFNVYECADGRWLQFNMVRNEELLSLAFAAMEVLHLLTDPRFASLELMYENRGAMIEELKPVVLTKPSAEWLAIFAEYQVPVNRIARVEETPDDAQILLNDMAVVPKDRDHPVPRIINHPVKITSVPQVGPVRAPGLGEHSAEILAELGYDQATIAKLIADGVV